MAEQRLLVWCKIMQRWAEVLLEPARSAQVTIRGLPPGQVVKECLAKDVDCFGKSCPFTMDADDNPFGEPSDPPPER